MKTFTHSIKPHAGIKKLLLRACIAACLAGTGMLFHGAAPTQPPAQPAPQVVPPVGRGGGARGGIGGIPKATPAQNAAITQMNTDLTAPLRTLTTARAELVAATFAAVRDDAAIQAKVQAVKAAELALANARADSFAKIQASANKLTPAQIAAIPATSGSIGRGGGGGGGGAPGGVPNMNSNQVSMLMQMTGITQKFTPAVTAARAAVTAAALAEPRDDAAIKAKVEALGTAELALANARADALATIQASPDKLAPAQLTALIAMGGVIVSGSFSEPQPYNFNDHTGYVSLFDGKTLKGWDGNPKFWRVEDGAMVGESTPQNPSGNTYIAYRDLEAHDFTLKLEVKVEGSGGTGIQYRSHTGVPWLTAIAPNVTANVGPVNLAWMMTGPQADFWPSRDTTAKYSGQFYSENTPMRIMSFRGEVVEGAGMGTRRLMGNIGDRDVLGKLVKLNDWNEYTIIARGGTFLHIINGQLMSVMIDDDPTSSNNWSGQIGIEIEATTKVSVRNIWLKKLN
jgi:Spy/CpxP family protein refolding chaperone